MANKYRKSQSHGDWGLGIGDWGLGIGDWGLGPIPNPQLFPFNKKYIIISVKRNQINLP